jgi:hypothetical protein
MASACYRHYFIDLVQDADRWRVVGLTHHVNGRALLPPGFTYPDKATAEQYAKLAIDSQLRKG